MSTIPSRAERAAANVMPEALKHFAAAIFARAGMSGADAKIVAEVLVWANLRGVDTHGVMRVFALRAVSA